jgi:hypothetical protein
VSLSIPLGLKGELSASIALSPLKATLELRGQSKITSPALRAR